jgi:hypothetical protein
MHSRLPNKLTITIEELVHTACIDPIDTRGSVRDLVERSSPPHDFVDDHASRHSIVRTSSRESA